MSRIEHQSEYRSIVLEWNHETAQRKFRLIVSKDREAYASWFKTDQVLAECAISDVEGCKRIRSQAAAIAPLYHSPAGFTVPQWSELWTGCF